MSGDHNKYASDSAFPCMNDNGYWVKGMTLRDWMAGKAMEAILANGYPITREIDADLRIARAAYQQADAMLEARKKINTACG